MGLAMTDFPSDADGNVLRGLKESGFDFSQRVLIDFNVDFKKWPPAKDAVRMLEKKYPSVKIYEPEEGYPGYLQFQVYELLTYQLVTRVQTEVSAWMAPFEGECISWGVLHDPPR